MTYVNKQAYLQKVLKKKNMYQQRERERIKLFLRPAISNKCFELLSCTERIKK